MSQLTFDDVVRPLDYAPRGAGDRSIDEEFEEFHRRNPQVFVALREKSLALKSRGFDHHSIDAVMHAVRWDASIKLGPGGEWKLNNNFTSRYARLLMRRVPELEGFFRIRALREGA